MESESRSKPGGGKVEEPITPLAKGRWQSVPEQEDSEREWERGVEGE